MITVILKEKYINFYKIITIPLNIVINKETKFKSSYFKKLQPLE